KVAVITGAAAGIGQAYARRLADDGAKVVVADAQDGDATVRLVQAAGGSAVAVRCDVSEPTQGAGARAGRGGTIRPLRYPRQQCRHLSHPDVRRDDVRGLASAHGGQSRCAVPHHQGVCPGMRRRHWGRIVNMASDTFLSNLTGFAHYIASKGGVIGLTRALASEFGEDGVTVNAIAPGLVRTPGTSGRRRRPAPPPAHQSPPPPTPQPTHPAPP